MDTRNCISNTRPAGFFPETCHDHWSANSRRKLAYDPSRDLVGWRLEVEAKLRELLGDTPEIVSPDVRIEFEAEHDDFHETRFVFTSEPGAEVPCHLLIPRRGQASYPVVICLQGHTPGMHLSLGRVKDEDLRYPIEEECDYALQAVREGYAALTVEQRCFGERKDGRPPHVHDPEQLCGHASMAALMLGRTMIGERVWDVSRAIDVLETLPEIDSTRIGLMGHSGGGTAAYYATCLEPRVSVAMASCSIVRFGGSIWPFDHCYCNYVPGILKYFEIDDLSVLIAPRPLVLVAGVKDVGFPIEAAEETFDAIRNIYAALGAPGKCRLVVGPEGHQFYGRLSWPVFRELSGWEAER